MQSEISRKAKKKESLDNIKFQQLESLSGDQMCALFLFRKPLHEELSILHSQYRITHIIDLHSATAREGK